MKNDVLKQMKVIYFPSEFSQLSVIIGEKLNISLCDSKCMQRNKVLCGTRSCYVAQANCKLLGSGEPSAPIPSALALCHGVATCREILINSVINDSCLPEQAVVVVQKRCKGKFYTLEFLFDQKVSLKNKIQLCQMRNGSVGKSTSE